MKFAKVKDNIIVNVIEAPEDWSPEEDYVPLPEGLWTGDYYIPSIGIPVELKLKAQQERLDFLEDCIAEMAMVVYQ